MAALLVSLRLNARQEGGAGTGKQGMAREGGDGTAASTSVGDSGERRVVACLAGRGEDVAGVVEVAERRE